MYSCPPMPPVPCPPPCPPVSSSDDPSDKKYYREIGSAMIGNQLIIRMERDKKKSKRSQNWDPPCDCDLEIQRPSSKEGPKILKASDNNRILFHVQPTKEDLRKFDIDDRPQILGYEVGQCKGGPNTNNQCRTFTIYPVTNGSEAQEVHTDRIVEGNDNVFLLKVKKKSESIEEPKRHVEFEVRTPRDDPATNPEFP